MSMNNLTIDGEFRYIIEWFKEWSELQRDDFIPSMVDYVTGSNDPSTEAAVTINVNGLQNDMEPSVNLNGKPMSLFQCRIKLFNQWNRKWPLEFKDKLQQKITEIDQKVGERIKESSNIKYNGSGNLTNGCTGSNDDLCHYEQWADEKTTRSQQQQASTSNDSEDQQLQVGNEMVIVTNAVTLNDPMREVLSNETSVDDIELNEDISKRQQLQPQQQVNTNNIGSNDNDNVANAINEDCGNRLGGTTTPHDQDDDHVREPVEQVIQMQNLQINEEEDHEDVTASAEQQLHTTASAEPVTVTVNPVVVVVTQAMATNAEVPLVV